MRADLKWPVLALGVLLLVNALLSPSFISFEIVDGRLFGTLVDILNRAVPTLLIALGMTLAIATRGVDLSVGAVMAISGTIAATMVAQPPGASLPLLVLTALGVASLAGLFNGLLVAVFQVQPIVATLILMVAGRGVAQLIAGGQVVNFQNAEFKSLGSGSFLYLPIPIWIYAFALLALTLFTRKTALGLFVAASGSSPEAARFCGVNVRAVKASVYVLCAFFAGLAGLIMTADISAADANNLGLYLELDAILAVALGGTSMSGGKFSLAGSAVGALLMQTVTTMMLTYGVKPELNLMLKAVLVIAVCLVQSEAFRERFRRSEAV